MLSINDERAELAVQEFFKKINWGKVKYKIVQFDSQTSITKAISQALKIIREEKGTDLALSIKLYSSNKELAGLGIIFKPFGDGSEYPSFIPIQFEGEILLPDQILIAYC